MEYIIIAVIILIAAIITVFLFRKKHNAEIERLEQLKLQIQNKPILEELTKVKQLNMNGQTEEMFERWRAKWTEVMDIHIPKVDASLFDAEDAIDRLRFRKASAIEKQIEKDIEECDKEMTKILNELEELIGSEEKNRTEMDVLKEQYKLARKKLLAHQYSFGVAAEPLEKRLESFAPAFKEYDELTDQGNYLAAREIVIGLLGQGTETFTLIEEVPTLLSEIQSKIPASINELKSGQREMEEQTYYLGHLELTGKLDAMEAELAELKLQVSEMNTAPVKVRIQEMKDEIESFYDLLEDEVEAKHFVEAHQEETAMQLEQAIADAKEISAEAALVQRTYKLPEQEAAIPKDLQSQLEKMYQRFELLHSRTEEQQSAYSGLSEELEDVRAELLKVQGAQAAFSQSLRDLRVEENGARSRVEELKRQLIDTDRILHKANIPGIPEELDARFEEAEEDLFVVIKALNEVPLNMKQVSQHLAKAEMSIEEVAKRTDETIENVELVERIIQYGNRYRKADQQLDGKLKEAEESFRQLRYAKALEEAATAVEDFEPGSMKRIEVLSKEEAWRM